MGIAMEFHFRFVATYFKVLLDQTGRGIWYLFLATLAFGTEWWAVLVGLMLVCNGMLNSYVACVWRMNNAEGRAAANMDVCEEEIELKVELGKLEDMDGDLEIKHEKLNNQVADDMAAEARAEC